jgi:carboxypeptidase C (cathepsin A)
MALSPHRLAPVALALFVLANSPARAEPEGEAKPPAFDARESVTHHEAAFAGKPLAYTATAGFLPLKSGDKGETVARIFVVAYTADGAAPAERPVTFLFNGGPGAASAYLHLGAVGPRAIVFAADGRAPAAPARLADNPDSWLDATDLVFIDPVGTGFSRLTKEDEHAERRLLGVEGDVEAMAETIRLWTTRNGRWSSPKFLAGESYGGYRVAALARALIGRTGIGLNGAVLVSPVIDFATIRDGDAALLPAALRLPSLAASAAALGKTPGTPADAARAAEEYALGPYLSGLATLDLARLEDSRALFRRTAALTGLPETLVERNRGRVSAGLFAREIVRDRGQVTSQYDGAQASFDATPGSPFPGDDPILEGGKPAYATAYMAYVRDELKSPVEDEFRLLSDDVNGKWEWPRGRMPNAAGDLQEALALAPSLRVAIVHGRTDLVTPYLASEWVVRQTEMPPEVRARVGVTVLNGGHMFYAHPREREALAGLVRGLIHDAR